MLLTAEWSLHCAEMMFIEIGIDQLNHKMIFIEFNIFEEFW